VPRKHICLVTSELSWLLEQVVQEHMVPEQSYGSAQKKLKIFWKHLSAVVSPFAMVEAAHEDYCATSQNHIPRFRESACRSSHLYKRSKRYIFHI